MATGQPNEGQPSQEELQAYLQQMQAADPAEVVAQAFQVLAMGAEVKIGRPGARVLIDALAGITEATTGKLPEDLSGGMTNAVRQLQMAQVEAERQGSGQQEGTDPADQPGGPAAAGGPTVAQDPAAQGPATQDPAAPAPGQGGTPGPQDQGGGQQMTDRLWVPGR